MNLYGLVFIFSLIVFSGNSAKILGVFPIPGYSHHVLGSTLLKALWQRGHEITYISHFRQKETIKNWRDIPVDGINEKLIEFKGEVNSTNMLDLGDLSIYALLEYTNKFGVIIMDALLSQPEMQTLLHDPKQKFDVIILENLFDDGLIGLGHHFKCPVILLSPGPITFLNNYMFGSPLPSTYIPNMVTGFSGKNLEYFWNRIKNVYYDMLTSFLVSYKYIPNFNAILQKHLPNSPNLRDLIHNVSLMLLASHVSVSIPTPLVPAIKEVGGFHIQKPQPLPKDIKSYLDNCTEGVIVFSMGSNIRSTDFSEEKKRAILNSFGKINNKILWKFETQLEQIPENVKILSWLPQNDVLAHPNVIGLINHGGLLSTTEAVYHGKPLIGIPVVWDQLININLAVQAGYALSVPYKTLTEESFTHALLEIIQNKRYTKNVKLRSRIMHSEPIKPLSVAIYWTEYVIKFKGAMHLRSPALNFYWYQIYMLDIILFLTIILVGLYKVIFHTNVFKHKLKTE